jgi:hypothetical protein
MAWTGTTSIFTFTTDLLFQTISVLMISLKGKLFQVVCKRLSL